MQDGQDQKGAADGGGGGIRMGRLRGADRSTAAAKGGVSRSTGGSGGGYGDADVAKLKDAIQTLCQSTHPLGELAVCISSEQGAVYRRVLAVSRSSRMGPESGLESRTIAERQFFSIFSGSGCVEHAEGRRV